MNLKNLDKLYRTHKNCFVVALAFNRNKKKHKYDDDERKKNDQDNSICGVVWSRNKKKTTKAMKKNIKK